jgi:hypothetical protein
MSAPGEWLNGPVPGLGGIAAGWNRLVLYSIGSGTRLNGAVWGQRGSDISLNGIDMGWNGVD